MAPFTRLGSFRRGRGKTGHGANRVERLEGRALLTTVYVDCNPAIAVRDGLSWETALADLEPIMNSIKSGNNIKVADGTYYPSSTGDRESSFHPVNGVSVYGGYAGYGAANPESRDVVAFPSVLSGDIGVLGDNSDNSYHVLTSRTNADATAELNGFTITGGKADGVDLNGCGAGMLVDKGSPKLVYCTFTSNTAQAGGGMYVLEGSPTLIGCSFIRNIAPSGGGIRDDNSMPTLTGCKFIDNESTWGGGMINYNSSPKLTHCGFYGNTATYGGGFYSYYSTGLILTNCVFSCNGGGAQGGAIENDSSSPTVVNCTIVRNTATQGGGMNNFGNSSPVVTNCIFWNNGSSNVRVSGGSPVITYCDIEGGYAGEGNIDAAPVFFKAPSFGSDGVLGTADDEYGALELLAGSSGLDAGNNGAVPADLTVDYYGQKRIADVYDVADTGKGGPPTVDMGAFERVLPFGVHGTVYYDLDGDSVKDKSEKAIAGVGVYIDLNNNGKYNLGEPAATTDAGGKYHFTVQNAGVCRVRVWKMPTGFRTSGPALGLHEVSASLGLNAVNQDFLITKKALVVGTVFLDANKNGKKDSGEKGIKGWKVFVDADKDGKWDLKELYALTDGVGNYSLSLSAGSYGLRVLVKKGYRVLSPRAGWIAVKLTTGQRLTGKGFGVAK